MKLTNLFLLLLAVVVPTTTAQGQRSPPPQEGEDCPLTPACCEEDCCGQGTVWIAPFCVPDPGSPGFLGVYSPEYIEGCALRYCCEEDCCQGPALVFDIFTAYCVPAQGDETSSPTVAPTTTPYPTTETCDPIVAETQSNKTTSIGDSTRSPHPAPWRPVPGSGTTDDDMNWLYDWEKDGDHGVTRDGTKTWEQIIKEQSCNPARDYITAKEKADTCAKCNKEPTVLKKVLCAAQATKALLTSKLEKCFHNSVALLSILKCLKIKAEPEVFYKTDNGKRAGHAWVEVVIGGTRYMFDPHNEIYICQQ